MNARNRLSTPHPLNPPLPQELNNCLWALRVLRYRPPDRHMARLARRAAWLAANGRLDVRERSNMLAAFQTLRYPLAGCGPRLAGVPVCWFLRRACHGACYNPLCPHPNPPPAGPTVRPPPPCPPKHTMHHRDHPLLLAEQASAMEEHREQ